MTKCHLIVMSEMRFFFFSYNVFPPSFVGYENMQLECDEQQIQIVPESTFLLNFGANVNTMVIFKMKNL